MFVVDRTQVRTLSRLDLVGEFPAAAMLQVVFRTDPGFTRRILPRPLTAPAEPMGIAFVGEYPETNFGVGYREGAIFVQALHRRQLGWYCLTMPVDDDTALIAGRERFGFPKKIAEQIVLDRQDHHATGSVVRHGVEIMRLECEQSDPATLRDLDPIGTAATDLEGRPCRQFPSLLFKHPMSPSGRRFDYVPRLVRQVTLLRPREGLCSGAGKLVLASTPTDPLEQIPVRDIVTCLYGVWDNSMLPGRVVGHAWNVPRFLPYAMFDNDIPGYLMRTATQPLRGRERGRRWRAIRAY